jgi:L-seryl-tRNA(Ser) seleniumtransferase
MVADAHASRARLASLPKIDELVRRPEIEGAGLPRWALIDAARAAVEERRRALLEGAEVAPEVPSDELLSRARRLAAPSLRRVINATGVVLHTNLGRAPLAGAALARILEVARGYSNLEYALDERSRGSRHDHLAELLVRLTGAEAGVVVNNGAGAVLIALAALAAGREVVVSRGELIEIGGSFRVPDVMRASGARLVEVGTTNKTHLADYAGAIGPDTALLLKVHRSNFAIVGFTAEVELAELAALARERGVAVMVDLGSGALLDLAALGVGLPSEPTPASQIAAGADLVTFSGDKLLGGPQAGVMVGGAATIDRIRKHPLMRALRPDKLALAALEATLALYRDGRAADEVPTLRILSQAADALRDRAEVLRARVEATGAPARGLSCAVVEVTGAVGGGALPTAAPRSFALSLARPGVSAEELERALRAHEPPVLGRIADDRLLLDVLTVADDEVAEVAAAVAAAAAT